MAVFPPYQWCADGGYQVPQPAPRVFVFPPPPMYLQPPMPPVQYIPGPVGIYGIAQQQAPCGAPPKQSTAISPPPPPQEKKDAKKDDKKEKEKKDQGKKEDANKKEKRRPNSRAPPPLMPGTNYMFPMETLKLHIFKRAAKIWEPQYQGTKLEFKIFEADTQKTVKQMIEYVIGAKPSEGTEKCAAWCASECIEAGDDGFVKGTTINYSDVKAGGTFQAMGWSARRGQDLPPVWIAVHKS